MKLLLLYYAEPNSFLWLLMFARLHQAFFLLEKSSMWMVSLGASTFNRPGQLASLQAAESLLTGVSHTQSIRETGSVLLGPLEYIGMLIWTLLQVFFFKLHVSTLFQI
jgi:hypothetical protein